MATTTATLSLTSSDLSSDPLSLSTTKTCYKAGTTIGLDQSTGLNKVYLTAVTPVDIITVPGATKAGNNAKVYIANLSTDDTEYIIVTKGNNVIGRLYAGDYLWMPWSMRESANANNHHGDITITPSVATGMWVEWTCINEGTEYPTENLVTA